MQIQTQVILSKKLQTNFVEAQQCHDEQEKLKGIGSFVKDLKSIENREIFCYFSWQQIKNHADFLLDYLSKEKIGDKTLFFDTLASLDSMLSIFKLNLFVQLKFRKSFYRNIQKEFQLLCLQFENVTQEKSSKVLEFQLYSILFLLVMLIYFSGKKEVSESKELPLNIINKSFISSFISLEINITQKNQRIVGLIIAYLIKKINVKIYGQKMLKFILNHFDKIETPRTLYHFVYCLREIHLQREIDIKVIIKFGLLEKLLKVWIQTFQSTESIYLVDYINVILKKYPSLVLTLKTEELLLKLSDFDKINQFTIVHQGLILQIQGKLLPNVGEGVRQKYLQKAFQSCQKIDYSLKYCSCFVSYQNLDEIIPYVFPFLDSLHYICRNRELKNILFGLQVLNRIVDICWKNNAVSMLTMLKVKSETLFEELKSFHICRRDISKLQESFSKLISIQYNTLC